MTIEERLMRLYRHVLRVGDLPLAEALTRAFRREPALAAAADAELRAMPRGPARPSEGALCLVSSLVQGL